MALRLFLALAIFLAACSVNPHHPYRGGVGYSEVATSKTRYEVVYHGPSSMDEATAKAHAIVRAAEIGKANGMTHFRIVRSRGDMARETVHDPDLFPRNPWTGEQRRLTEWEWRREQELEEARRRRSAREVLSPVVRVVVDFTGADCETCLSVEETLKDAAEKGVLK
jgi:hypothetical protein